MSTPEVIGEGPNEVLKLHGHDKETIVQVLRQLAGVSDFLWAGRFDIV